MALFCTFEGIDGSGKTSTMEGVREKLIKDRFSVGFSREPGGGQIRDGIRNLISYYGNLEPLTQLYLFLADRTEHIKQLKSIMPYKDILLSDRYADSTIAYQVFGNEIDIYSLFHNPGNALTLGFIPDLTFYLKISYEGAKKRIEERGEKLSSFEAKGEDFYNRVIAGYEAQAKYNLWRIKTIEVEGKNKEEVVKECYVHIMNILEKKRV